MIVKMTFLLIRKNEDEMEKFELKAHLKWAMVEESVEWFGCCRFPAGTSVKLQQIQAS